MDISSLLSPNDTPASRHAATQRPDNDSAPAAPAKPAEATGPPAGDGNAISGGAKAAQTSAVRGPLARGRGGRRRNGDQNAPKASPPTTGQGRRGTTKTSKRKVSTSADEPDLATPSPLTSASVKGTTGSNGAVGRAPQPSRSSSDTLHRRALLNRPHNAIIQPSPEAVAVRPNHSYPGSIPMDNAVKYSASLKPTAKLPSTGAHYSRSTPNIPSHTAAYHTATSAGMDVLADVASMQQQQQPQTLEIFNGIEEAGRHNVRNTSPALHSGPGQANASHTLRQSLNHLALLPTTISNITTPDASDGAPMPLMVASSLTEEESKKLTEIAEQASINPFAYNIHAQLINLLHAGFSNHVVSSNPPESYELLSELRRARESMSSRFCIGESLLADWISDESLLACTVEDRVAVVERCRSALDDEPCSARLWKLYGDQMFSYWSASHSDPSSTDENDWSAEDRLVGQELFTWQTMTQVWEHGITATQWQLNDSNVVWDRYIEIMMDDQAKHPSSDKLQKLKTLFFERLVKPHAVWDNTFQLFSSFMSTYESNSYEETMVETNQRAANAKQQFALRETFEANISRAVKLADGAAERAAFNEYLDWEVRMQGVFSTHLINALYERATLRFSTDTEFWEDYIHFLTEKDDPDFPPLPAIKRAARHCPWSGGLWATYLLELEVTGSDFDVLENVKHQATHSGLLDISGIEELFKVYVGWCGFLCRRAVLQNADEDELDVAEVGIRSALEHVKEAGEKLYGPTAYRGDPHFRLERMYIKFLTNAGNFDGGRECWRKLVPFQADNYDFWYRYYIWEMVAAGFVIFVSKGKGQGPRTPKIATSVLREGLTHYATMDWPEKLVEMFHNHCEQHETVTEYRKGEILVRKVTKLIIQRRQHEAAAAAADASMAVSTGQREGNAAEAELNPTVTNGTADAEMVDAAASLPNKRKLEHAEGGTAGDANSHKRSRLAVMSSTEETEADADEPAIKRNREQTSIVVKNIPHDATEVQVKQFFRDCGTVKSIKFTPEDGSSTQTAIIEFESHEDALYAKSKEAKLFQSTKLAITVGQGATLWVTNFPPTADEKFIRDHFGSIERLLQYGEIVDVRFPSLLYNTHRRFCYVQFADADQAAAATELDGKALAGNHRLVVKVSDPSIRHDRTGAVHEEREVYLGNLDWAASDQEIQDLLEQHGTPENVRIPRAVSGKTKGFAFASYHTKKAALHVVNALHLKPFRDRVLQVSIAVPKGVKKQSVSGTVREGHDLPRASPATADMNGDGASPAAGADTDQPPSKPEGPSSNRHDRTIALLRIPDTVNDARIRALAEKYGPLRKMILKPERAGAILEFETVADAGRATLALDGYELVPGRSIAVGSVEEMLRSSSHSHSHSHHHNHQHGSNKAVSAHRTATGPGKSKGSVDGKVGAGLFAISSTVSRPLPRRFAAGGSARRGGLGAVRASAGRTDGRSGPDSASGTEAGTGASSGGSGGKSNADFRAMFSGKVDKDN